MHAYHFQAAVVFCRHWWNRDGEVGGLLALQAAAAAAGAAAPVLIAGRHLQREELGRLKEEGWGEGGKREGENIS